MFCFLMMPLFDSVVHSHCGVTTGGCLFEAEIRKLVLIFSLDSLERISSRSGLETCNPPPTWPLSFPFWVDYGGEILQTGYRTKENYGYLLFSCPFVCARWYDGAQQAEYLSLCQVSSAHLSWGKRKRQVAVWQLFVFLTLRCCEVTAHSRLATGFLKILITCCLAYLIFIKCHISILFLQCVTEQLVKVLLRHAKITAFVRYILNRKWHKYIHHVCVYDEMLQLLLAAPSL